MTDHASLSKEEQFREQYARPRDLHDMTHACGSLIPCTRVYDADDVDVKIEDLQLELKSVQEQYTNYHDWAQKEIARLQMLLETSLKFLRPDPSRLAVVTAHGLTRVQLCEAIEEALQS